MKRPFFVLALAAVASAATAAPLREIGGGVPQASLRAVVERLASFGPPAEGTKPQPQRH